MHETLLKQRSNVHRTTGTNLSRMAVQAWEEGVSIFDRRTSYIELHKHDIGRTWKSCCRVANTVD